jgi:hypothetical protein
MEGHRDDPRYRRGMITVEERAAGLDIVDEDAFCCFFG